jgi:hypothetical protein
MFRSNYAGLAFLVIVSGAFSACSGQTSNSLVPAQSSFVTHESQLMPRKIEPAPCRGQETTTEFASAEVVFASNGGIACVPSIGGFGGAMGYPPSGARMAVKLISSPTNYNHMPHLAPGKALFYLQVILRRRSVFTKISGRDIGIVGPGFTPNKMFTAFAGVTEHGTTKILGSCDAEADTSNFGGSLSGIGTLFNEQSIAPATVMIQIYPGKNAKTKRRC